MTSGYTHLIRSVSSILNRIEKYFKKEWTILGNHEFVPLVEKFTSENTKIISFEKLGNIFIEPKMSMIGYKTDDSFGIHFGYINQTHKIDIYVLELYIKRIRTNDRNVSVHQPILFYMPLKELIIYTNNLCL